MAASKPTDRQTDIHTHVHNAVPLVWGSLRLTPNMLELHTTLPTPKLEIHMYMPVRCVKKYSCLLSSIENVIAES